MMKLVVMESPYAGDILRNIAYARRAMRDSLMRGEAPFASHLLYTQPGVLKDEVPEERARGMSAGFSWGSYAELCVVYNDHGISDGMKRGIEVAKNAGIEIQYRSIGKEYP